jgi:ferritin-like protein
MDATGRAVEDAAKKRAKDLAERADEISLSRQLEKESLLKDVFDPKTPDQPLLIDEVESVGVAVNNDTVIIRTNTDIEQMTYGVIRGVPQEYNFKAGAKYKVSKDLAAYLNNLGYVSMIG